MQTILVCDDDKQIVEAIDIYLTGEGFKVIKHMTDMALEYLETQSADLLILRCNDAGAGWDTHHFKGAGDQHYTDHHPFSKIRGC